jgi:hypothetical protein
MDCHIIHAAHAHMCQHATSVHCPVCCWWWEFPCAHVCQHSSVGTPTPITTLTCCCLLPQVPVTDPSLPVTHCCDRFYKGTPIEIFS